MKIRSLLLGSVAAAGLSTGAYAADAPGTIFAALDICDALGISGLTIASDTNCLQITGGVSYEFKWGDYNPAAGLFDVANGDTVDVPNGNGPNFLDWSSRVEAWLQFVATADSDFGPARAVIKLKAVDGVEGVGPWGDVTTHGSDTDGVIIDEAYVAIGDSTVIMAGKKGSIMNKGDDVPLNFLGLFNSSKVDTGVNWSVDLPDGGHVIQVTSDLGNGVSVSAGLENLNGTDTTTAGTAVGVLAYAGDGFAAHVTVAAGGVLDGIVENWGIHAGVSGSFDMVRFVAAIAADSDGYWNGLASAAIDVDMFTIAGSVEAATDGADQDLGAGGSISAGVTDGVTINLGGRWYQANIEDTAEAWQAEAQIVAALTESITATGGVGAYAVTSANHGDSQVLYGYGELAWAPGGGFTSSVKGEVFTGTANIGDTDDPIQAYRITTKFGKTFE